MLNVLRAWMHRYFSDEEAIVLAVVLAVGSTIVLAFGSMLAPVLAALVITFLIQGVVGQLERLKVPPVYALWSVFALFIGCLLLFLLVLMPLLWKQVFTLLNELPGMVSEGQKLLMRLPEHYPQLVSERQLAHVIDSARGGVGQLGQWVLSFSLSSLPFLINMMIYLVLVPMLVFFFLKDRSHLRAWINRYLPRERNLITQVWDEMNQQIANYIRGKVLEILITGLVTYATFAVLGLNYAALLGLLVGLSVLVPYIGALVVTVPVALIGLFQWGWSDQFIWLMVAYGVIQALDGNVLVPWLFSEAVNLHPVAIIVAVLLFGGLWGFWGVFFAIPLATLVKAVLAAWPRATTLPEPLA